MKSKFLKTLTILIITSFLVSLIIFGDFKVKAQPSSGVVTIAFDDSRQSQYDNAYPLMESYGFVGTYYVITGLLGAAGYMTVQELETIQNSGNEIGSHSVDHPDFTYLSDADIRAECSESQQFLQANGFSGTDFAYPYGAYNDHTNSIVAQYYRSARSAYAEPYVMSLPTSQFPLQGYPGETSGDISQLEAIEYAESFVDQVASNGGWVIIFFHNVVWGDYTDAYTIAAEYFESFLAYVQASGVSVLTVSQALDIAGPSLSASISPTSVNLNPGGSQQFSSTVTGGVSPYTYQWYVNGSPVTGATSAKWTFNPTSIGTYKIYLRATDSYVDSTQSNTATAYVTPPLTATINPTQARIILGQSQNFTSSVSGGATPYTYQWVLNDTAVSGATTSIWKFTPTQTGHYKVYLNVTDSLNKRAQSNIVSDIIVNNQPSVLISPSSANITLGGSQQFNSTVTGGFTPYTYQWCSNNTAVPNASTSTWIFTPNSTGTFNIYLNVTDNSNFRVQSNAATVKVYSQPNVAITPSQVKMYYGQSQTFSSSVSGGALPYTYQWCVNDTAVSGATGSTWVFTPKSNGHYMVYLNITDGLNFKVKSNVSSVLVCSVCLALTVEPSQVSYVKEQSVTFTVDVFNPADPAFETSLTLTVRGPSDYCYFDVQPIKVPAGTLGEYTFQWVVPNATGKYVAEVVVLPSLLTAYDTAWLVVA